MDAEARTAATYQAAVRSPGEAREALLSLWADNLPVRGGVEPKFTWCYERAPLLPDGVLLLDAPGVGRAVGTAGYGLRRFHVAGRGEVVAGLMADLAVDRLHRTLSPALALVRAARDHVVSRSAFSYGFPNERAEAVFARAGYGELGRTERHVLVLRHASYVARVLRMPFAPGVLGAALDVARAVAPAVRRARECSKFALEWSARIDDRFDRLWQTTRDTYPIVARRDAAFVRWRLREAPAGRCEVVALLDRASRGLPLAAYAALEHDGRNVHLRDLFGHPHALAPMMDAVIVGLVARGAHALSFRCLPTPRLRELLASRGFLPRPAERARLVCFDAGTTELPARDQWWITDADEDT